jgi:hypothetical protein
MKLGFILSIRDTGVCGKHQIRDGRDFARRIYQNGSDIAFQGGVSLRWISICFSHLGWLVVHFVPPNLYTHCIFTIPNERKEYQIYPELIGLSRLISMTSIPFFSSSLSTRLNCSSPFCILDFYPLPQYCIEFTPQPHSDNSI